MNAQNIETDGERRHRIKEESLAHLEQREREAGLVIRPHTPRLARWPGHLEVVRVVGNDTHYRWVDDPPKT